MCSAVIRAIDSELDADAKTSVTREALNSILNNDIKNCLGRTTEGTRTT